MLSRFFCEKLFFILFLELIFFVNVHLRKLGLTIRYFSGLIILVHDKSRSHKILLSILRLLIHLLLREIWWYFLWGYYLFALWIRFNHWRLLLLLNFHFELFILIFLLIDKLPRASWFFLRLLNTLSLLILCSWYRLLLLHANILFWYLDWLSFLLLWLYSFFFSFFVWF